MDKLAAAEKASEQRKQEMLNDDNPLKAYGEQIKDADAGILADAFKTANKAIDNAYIQHKVDKIGETLQAYAALYDKITPRDGSGAYGTPRSQEMYKVIDESLKDYLATVKVLLSKLNQ